MTKLVQHQRRYTVAQIAAEFDVTRPTIYRHLSAVVAATTAR
ncbi:MAG: ArsR family transcriptional regulator [Mycobacterium sp.]